MIYEPREDSILLAKQVREYAHGDVLDMGTGSGIQAVTAADLDQVKDVIAVDIQPEVIEHCRKIKNNKIRFLVSDLFENVQGEFDVIIFNPPYLPYDPRVPDVTLDGGKKGYEIIERFLAGLNKHLRPKGICLLLFSTLTKRKKVEEIIEQHVLDFTVEAREKLAFEELFVYKIEKKVILKELESNGISNVEKFTKGKRGYIFTGMYKGKKVAIKYQRQDIGAMGTVNLEANVLKDLNKHKIGPNLLFSGNDYIVYDFIEGEFILDYAKKHDTKKVILNVFDQMRTLDKLNYNKDEMHHPWKHILIGKKVVLIDFERCKKTEKPQNVTQFCQFVYNKLGVSKKILELAKKYKDEMTEENYQKIINFMA